MTESAMTFVVAMLAVAGVFQGVAIFVEERDRRARGIMVWQPHEFIPKVIQIIALGLAFAVSFRLWDDERGRNRQRNEEWFAENRRSLVFDEISIPKTAKQYPPEIPRSSVAPRLPSNINLPAYPNPPTNPNPSTPR